MPWFCLMSLIQNFFFLFSTLGTAGAEMKVPSAEFQLWKVSHPKPAIGQLTCFAKCQNFYLLFRLFDSFNFIFPYLLPSGVCYKQYKRLLFVIWLIVFHPDIILAVEWTLVLMLLLVRRGKLRLPLILYCVMVTYSLMIFEWNLYCFNFLLFLIVIHVQVNMFKSSDEILK